MCDKKKTLKMERVAMVNTDGHSPGHQENHEHVSSQKMEEEETRNASTSKAVRGSGADAPALAEKSEGKCKREVIYCKLSDLHLERELKLAKAMKAKAEMIHKQEMEDLTKQLIEIEKKCVKKYFETRSLKEEGAKWKQNLQDLMKMMDSAEKEDMEKHLEEAEKKLKNLEEKWSEMHKATLSVALELVHTRELNQSLQDQLEEIKENRATFQQMLMKLENMSKSVEAGKLDAGGMAEPTRDSGEGAIGNSIS